MESPRPLNMLARCPIGPMGVGAMPRVDAVDGGEGAGVPGALGDHGVVPGTELVGIRRRRSSPAAACSPCRSATATRRWSPGTWDRRSCTWSPTGFFVGAVHPVAAGVHAVLGLPVAAAGPVQAEAVGLHVGLVEAGLVAVHAVGVDGQLGDRLSRRCRRRSGSIPWCPTAPGSRRRRPPCPCCRRCRWCRSPSAGRTACRRCPSRRRPDPGVLGHRSTLSCLIRSSSGTSWSLLANSGYFCRWSVNTSGAVPDDEPGGQLRPVVVPAELLDLDREIGVRGVERVRTLLVGRLLIGVPQPVADLAAAAACAAPAPLESVVSRCRHAGGHGQR